MSTTPPHVADSAVTILARVLGDGTFSRAVYKVVNRPDGLFGSAPSQKSLCQGSLAAPKSRRRSSLTVRSFQSLLRKSLGDDQSQFPKAFARYLLTLGFSEDDKARLHDLAVRNQADALAPEEKELLLAYGKAGSLLSILKSKARRTLQGKPQKRHTS